MSESMALTMAEAARALSISRAQIYKLANRGELPYVMVGQRRRVSRAALEAILAGDRNRDR
jgi:excisionase family DNA binding protein